MTLKDGLAFWGGPVGFVLALALLPGGEVHQGALAGTAWWMLWWWIGGAMPLGPTSLLPLALFPVFGVMDLSATAAPFGSRFIWLFLGGFVLALALERHGLHRRFALHLLHRLGGGPRRTLFGFMLATALLSMWISNTATTLMMLPMATAVLGLLEEREGRRPWGPALILGVAVCSLVLSFAAGSMVSARGVAGPTIGASLQPVQATLTLAACLAVAFIVAVMVGRVVNAAVAAFAIGAGLAALSMQTGTHLDLLFADASLVPVAIETLAWSVVVLLIASGLMRLTGPLPDQPWNDARTSTMPAMVFESDALRGALAGGLAVVVVWAVAANDLKLQAIAASTLAGRSTV